MRPFTRTPPLGAPPRSARERVLAAWRGVDVVPAEKARRDSFRPVSGLVSQTLVRMGLDRKRGEAEVVKVWNDLIDPTLTAHAQPTGLNKGTLFVSVDHPGWHADIVRWHRKKILEQMRAAFGGEMIQRISFRIG